LINTKEVANFIDNIIVRIEEEDLRRLALPEPFSSAFLADPYSMILSYIHTYLLI